MAKNRNSGNRNNHRPLQNQRKDNPDKLLKEARSLADLFMKGNYEEVDRLVRKLLAGNPTWGFGWKLQAGSAAVLSRYDDALHASIMACRYLPGDPEVLSNHGNILKDRGSFTEAIDCYRRAIKLRPDFQVAYNNLGNALKNQGRLREAIEAYENALRITPDFIQAYDNLLFAHYYLPCQDNLKILELHRLWEAKLGLPSYARSRNHPNIADPEKPLNIGYISSDLGRHPVGIFMLSVLPCHDRERCRVFCYSDRPNEDDLSGKLREHVDCWRRTSGLGHAEVAELVRRDGIDILVDLAGHTAGNRLPVFAMKPAPVQVTWLGYPGTTGLSAMDYRLTDALADPPGSSDLYASEKLVRLPEGFLCFCPPDIAPEPTAPPLTRNGFVTFGSFNFLPKLTEEAIELWAGIMQSLPGSRLILKSPPLADAGTSQRIADLFGKAGIERERIEFRGATAGYQEHLLAYGDIDIAFDTFPYNGTTTIFEALWMGVPVVTVAGTNHVSRVGMSILERLGLGELVAGDAEGYRQIAARLAASADRLASLRKTLRQKVASSSFGNAKGFVNSLEKAYAWMWEEYCTKRR